VHPLVPEFILKNYAAGHTEGSIPSIGLFVDISGFSAMTDRLMEHGQHGAEVLAEVMRSVFIPLMESVYEQGGFVIAQAGDAFTALIPLTPDPAGAGQRALTAAWNIRTRAAANGQFSTVYGNFAITVKVGLALGETAWGIITASDERRAAYYFQGTAVDESAEAEHHAGPGDLISNAAFFELVKSSAVFEPVDRFYRLTDIKSPLTAPAQYTRPSFDLDLAARFYRASCTCSSKVVNFDAARTCLCAFLLFELKHSCEFLCKPSSSCKTSMAGCSNCVLAIKVLISS
jgi:class 3 adenylate cyclase